MKVIGIIPARGGSKGVKKKNIRVVAGEPLIAYAIRTAKESTKLDYFVVTTDDPEIAEVAKQYGAPVIMRPKELAKDNTPMVPVVIHALEEVEKESEGDFDIVVLLQPTSPIRRGVDVDDVIKLFEDSDVECVVSVCDVADMHPARMYRLTSSGFIVPFWPEFESLRRQDLPKVYYRNGTIYAIRTDVLKEQKTFMCNKKKAYIMPAKWMVNIDSERDLLIADVMVKLWKEGKL